MNINIIKKLLSTTAFVGLFLISGPLWFAQDKPADTQQMLQQIKQFQQVINQQKLSQNQPVAQDPPPDDQNNNTNNGGNANATPSVVVPNNNPSATLKSRQQLYNVSYYNQSSRSQSVATSRPQSVANLRSQSFGTLRPQSVPTLRAPFSNSRVPLTAQEEDLHKQAFQQTMQGLFPMTPEQIHRLRQLYTASQYAASAPPGLPPKATAVSMRVDLSPGATPPAINLAEGDVTAVVFLDATSAPWPIEAFDNGNPRDFDIQWNRKDNVLLIQATSSFGRGNLAVRLRALGPPIMISLVTNHTVELDGVVDYRVDMQVPGFGPNAVPPPVVGLPAEESPVLLSILDGVPPAGSKKLDFCGGVGQAWLVGDKMFVRTPYTLLSPAWLSTISSADGTHVYEIQPAPLLLMSENGKITQIKLEGL